MQINIDMLMSKNYGPRLEIRFLLFGPNFVCALFAVNAYV